MNKAVLISCRMYQGENLTPVLIVHKFRTMEQLNPVGLLGSLQEARCHVPGWFT